jgi:hypothetical protein
MKLVGRIRAVCAQGGRRNTIGGLGAAGDDRRTPNEVHRCPRRTRAVGMRARGGELVDRVRLICRRFNRSGEPTGSRRYTGAIGGRGGTARSLMCPRGEYATGFAGSLRRGDTDVIDWLRLSCA